MNTNEQNEQEQLRVFSARLPLSLIKRLKLLSVQEDLKLKDITEEALRDWLSKHDKHDAKSSKHS